MAIKTIDELNMRSEPPEEYFGEMDLTKPQIKERIEYTEEAKEKLVSVMDLIALMVLYGYVDYEEAQRQLYEGMNEVVGHYTEVDDYLTQYINDFVSDFIGATQRNIGEDWYLSEDRALFDAENSANDAINYKDYKKALQEGKMRKKWVSKSDTHVRITHQRVDNKIIPIRDYFEVGESLMRFPKDIELAFDNPREFINCRCVVKYLD